MPLRKPIRKYHYDRKISLFGGEKIFSCVLRGGGERARKRRERKEEKRGKGEEKRGPGRSPGEI